MNTKRFEALQYAVSTGDMKLLDYLTKDFDSFDQDEKEELLKYTVLHGPDTEVIQHVLDLGYDLAYTDEDDNTLLHYAAAGANPATVRFFLSKGLDIEATNCWDATPLCTAAKECDNPAVLKALIDAGANTEVTSHGGETLLITAAGLNDNPEVIKFLLKMGFDLEARDDDGLTPLLNAALWQDDSDILSLLIDAGANFRAKSKHGDTIYHLAAMNTCRDIAGFLSTIFNVSETNNEGETCMDRVLKRGRSAEVLKVYLNNMKEEQVMKAASNSNPRILETLINAGYDANTTTASGMTALMFAAKVNDNPEIIQMLRYYDACWECHDSKGRNALHYAAVNSDPDIYDWMLEDDDFKTLAEQKDSKGKIPSDYRENPQMF